MGSRVSIDIADGSESVTATVKRFLGDAAAISSDEVHLLANGWARLRRDGSNLYISPRAIESIHVEDGDLSDTP